MSFNKGGWAGVNWRTKAHFFSCPTFPEIIYLPGQPYQIIEFSFILSMNFWNFYIFVSKIKNFGKNFILVPGFMVNPFVFLSVVGPVPVLQFTPVAYWSQNVGVYRTFNGGWFIFIFYIYSSKIRNFGKNFALVPGFMVNPFVFLSMFGLVPVLWFTPVWMSNSHNYRLLIVECSIKSNLISLDFSKRRYQKFRGSA